MLSWHNHHRFTGPDPRVFAAHVAQEIEVWMSNGKLENAHNGVQNFWDDDSSNQLWVHSPPLDMMIGMYERGISWWRKHWHRDQLFVMNYDHFVSDNTTLLREIGRFTGLDLLDTPMPRVNLHSQTARSIAAMCCETYCALQLAAFTDSNARLYEMMDADADDGDTCSGSDDEMFVVRNLDTGEAVSVAPGKLAAALKKPSSASGSSPSQPAHPSTELPPALATRLSLGTLPIGTAEFVSAKEQCRCS